MGYPPVDRHTPVKTVPSPLLRNADGKYKNNIKLVKMPCQSQLTSATYSSVCYSGVCSGGAPGGVDASVSD